MYVADITDITEAKELLAEAHRSHAASPSEQTAWDIEDLEGRIEELT
jgi:hypothetical protein